MVSPRHRLWFALASLAGLLAGFFLFDVGQRPMREPPNFLLVITDDQSWLHTGYAGDPLLQTPNMDRIANEGVMFENAFASAPTCTASRSAILAGQHFWRLGPAAQLWGEYPSELLNYQKILEQHGYAVGYTGKGWGPGKSAQGNPAGKDFNEIRHKDVDPNLSVIDHVANLRLFLSSKKPGQPFSFWVSPTEPHRPFKPGSGVASGRFPLAQVPVPPFLPDDEKVRSDIADYLFEIEWFDQELGRILALLKETGNLDNTVIVFTSDNGMAFPRAKSNNYDYGTHIPLAIRWGAAIDTPHTATDFVSHTDLAPTFLDLAGIPVPPAMTGKSLRQQILASRSGRIDAKRDAVFTGFQRHIGNARLENRGYPSRAIHADGYLYIENFAPERWPAGRPPTYADIDDGSPSKNALVLKPEYKEYLELAGGKRPAVELYRVAQDPGQVNNVAADPEYNTIRQILGERLRNELKRTADPVAENHSGVFDAYPYTAPVRE